MSKMDQLHLTLDEQAVELGFEGLGEALMKGYDVDYEKGKLVRRGLGYSETVEYLAKEQEKAHEAWLKERDDLCERLRVAVHRRRTLQDYNLANLMAEAHDFIKEWCHE